MMSHPQVYWHCSFSATLTLGGPGGRRQVKLEDLKAAKDEGSTATATGRGGSVAVTVNRKPVTLLKHRVTGLEIKQGAIAQGVEIEEDFLLTEEAHDGHNARTIPDDKTITVTRHSVFTANDVDDDS